MSQFAWGVRGGGPRPLCSDIMVRRGNEQQTIPAGHLRVGDIVLCADGKHRIGEIEHGTQHVEVYQLFFQPDVAIETFYTMDPAILTRADWHKSRQAWQAVKDAGLRACTQDLFRILELSEIQNVYFLM